MSYSSSSYTGYSRFIFLLMGAIFLVVGLGLAIGLGGIPFAGGVMSMMGGIFAVIGIIFIIAGFIAGRNAARTDQILQTGIPDSAQITGPDPDRRVHEREPADRDEPADPAARRGSRTPRTSSRSSR